ncbi:MAG: sugar phosphate isomerase/epimerase [Geminicoccaceae bacterium]|nr:sugar phosphate isomerase/epimerase [Geminicoccaceae bacterium]HRY24618.1 sugar phosphate isomerase/epimerase family protein [Geminicoccaceae bacterium]
MQQLGALSLTSWSLTHCTLGEAANIGRALGIEGLDLGLLHGPALAKGRLLADPEALAGEIRRLGIICPNLYWLFGNGLVDRNLADPEARAANEADFRRVLAFATAASIPTIFVLPGVCGRGIGREAALERSAASLRPLAAMAGDAGVTLTVEPHVGGFLESPGLTLALLDAVPGLKLTLDYAHFACLGFTQGEIDPLAPHAAHVHLRQARPGALQCKLEHGTLNFPAMLATLAGHGYRGRLAIEYVHQGYMDTLHDDVLSETIKMRDLVRLQTASPAAR